MTSVPMNSPTTCWLTYLGEVRRVDSTEHFLFGRGAGNNLDVERKPDDLLHRRLGRVFHHNGIWWIVNDGTHLSIAINDRSSTSSIVLAPGGSAALTFAHGAICFSARRPDYQILIDVDVDDDASGANDAITRPPTGPQTSNQADLPLVGEQRLLLIALAESKLTAPHKPLELPANKAVARRFGWGEKAFDGKLRRLCEKFDRWGMPGLIGETVDPATDRRRKLVDYAIDRRIITKDDLELIAEYPAG